MGIKVAILSVDEKVMKESGSSFETEMGWVNDSGISLSEYYEIPSELEDIDPIEAIWLMGQTRESLQALKESGEIKEITPELEVKLVKTISNDYESIEQDIDWKIRSELGVQE